MKARHDSQCEDPGGVGPWGHDHLPGTLPGSSDSQSERAKAARSQLALRTRIRLPGTRLAANDLNATPARRVEFRSWYPFSLRPGLHNGLRLSGNPRSQYGRFSSGTPARLTAPSACYAAAVYERSGPAGSARTTVHVVSRFAKVIVKSQISAGRSVSEYQATTLAVCAMVWVGNCTATVPARTRL
jgi:hypothetical protein